MEDHGVIQINKANGPRQGGGGPPGGRAIPPPPPMHHGGQNQGGARPIIMTANPGPRQQAGQNQQIQQARMMNQGPPQFPSLAQERQAQAQTQAQAQAQAQAMAMAMLPPQPPRNLVPRPLIDGPVVQISDIRREAGRLTEAEAREELSEFVIFRFERADQATDYDSEGERVRPTWSNVVRTEVRGISKKEAARQIKSLHDIHKSMIEKKASLTDAQQRQLEKVLEELEMREDDHRYHYVLVQIDRKLRDKKWRSKSRDRVEFRRGDKRYGEKTRRYSENRGRRENVEVVGLFGRQRSMVREPKKKVQETTSITAYYKRCPKSEVDAIAMVLQREAHNARHLEPPYPHHTFGPHQMQQHHQAQLNGNMGMGMGMGHGMGMGPPQGNTPMLMGNPNIKMGGNPNQNNNRNGNGKVQVVPDKQSGNNKNNNNNNNQQRRKSPHPHPNRRRSPTSSRESMYSDTDSFSDSDSIITPNSSYSSNSRNKHRGRRLSSPTKLRRGSRYIEEPAHFGVPPRSLTPHKQRRHEEHRIADELFPLSAVRRSLPPLAPVAPLPPSQPRISVDEIDEIQANAYAAGRQDERVDLRERAEVLRPLQPRVVHHHPARRTDGFLLEEEGVGSPLLPSSPPLMSGARGVPLRPRVLQHRPSVRLVRPGDVALDEDVIDSLERFRLEDEGIRGGVRYRDEMGRGEQPRYVDEYYDDVILRSERRRIEEARLRDEEMAIERERDRVDRARGFLRRADSEGGDVFYERDGVDTFNPFVPRPGMARRATVGFAGREYI